MDKRIYKQQLIEKLNELRNIYEFTKERLIENIFAGVCSKSILIQKKNLFDLEIKINCLEYKIQHDIYHNNEYNE